MGTKKYEDCKVLVGKTLVVARDNLEEMIVKKRALGEQETFTCVMSTMHINKAIDCLEAALKEFLEHDDAVDNQEQ